MCGRETILLGFIAGVAGIALAAGTFWALFTCRKPAATQYTVHQTPHRQCRGKSLDSRSFRCWLLSTRSLEQLLQCVVNAFAHTGWRRA